jgi:hypothetical protein
MEQQVGDTEARLQEVEEQLANLRGQAINLDGVNDALAEFEGLWDVLVPHERGRLIYSIVDRVILSPDFDFQVVFRTKHRQV